MRLLAIETSTEFCSAALWLDGVVRESHVLAGQKHSQWLLGQVMDLLREAGLTVAELDGIAYGRGPGSFTGVRIACGVAQGLALGADVPVVGVTTLLALAAAAGQARVLAVLDARMGELYLAAYQRDGEDWREVLPPCLCRAETAPDLPGEGWHGVGSGFAAQGAALAARYAGQLAGVDAQVVPQAGSVARLAAREFAAGRGLDAALAQPLYLRDKVAKTTAERLAAGGAA